MVRIAAVAASALVLATQALAANLTIISPSALIECRPALISWSGGTAPYYVSVLPGGQTSGTPLATIDTQPTTDLSFSWTVNVAAGTSVTLEITDDTGLPAYSGEVTVQAGTSSSCLTTGTSASASASSAGSVISSASASAVASSSSAAPVVSSSTSSVASSSAASSATSSPAATSASATTKAASASAATTATGTASAAATSAAATGAAGKVGASVAALFGAAALMIAA